MTCYKQLREGDAVPGSQTAYRITVRQLEALVRLSEALARLRCSEVIRPAFVREVCDLKPSGNLLGTFWEWSKNRPFESKD